MWALFDRWCDYRYAPSRGVPAALCHPRDLARPVARRRADATAAKLACAEIGG